MCVLIQVCPIYVFLILSQITRKHKERRLKIYVVYLWLEQGGWAREEEGRTRDPVEGLTRDHEEK